MPPRQYQRYNARPKEQTARLIYEPALNGYSLKFTYNESILDFIKKAIPSHKRTTSGPPDWIWYFGEEYFDIIKLLFDGHRDYKLTIVTRQEVEQRVKEVQESQQYVRTTVDYSIDNELQKFANLIPLETFKTLGPIMCDRNNKPAIDVVKNWTKDYATKVYRCAATLLHPDKGGDPVKMAELNNTWSILKEAYYIK